MNLKDSDRTKDGSTDGVRQSAWAKAPSSASFDSPHVPLISFVLATHNRGEVVRHTLTQLERCGLQRRDYEIIVIDNASHDRASDALAPCVDRLLRLHRNQGSCAKTLGAQTARGTYIVFLDDDSFPKPGSVSRMMERFEEDPSLGAAGFTIHLPDGLKEGAALPGVFVGCGVGFRADALRQVGGLDRTFFMQAEEYDLSFRLVQAGWRIEVFEDLQVEHLKTPRARRSGRTTFLDIRNNLRVAARYLPGSHYKIYRQDWLQRYTWLAEHTGHQRAHRRGTYAGRLLGAIERLAYRPRRLSPSDLEFFFRWDDLDQRVSSLAESGVRRILLADLGKNVFAFHRAIGRAGLELCAIGDDRFAAPQRTYRGTLIRPVDTALRLDFDAVIVGQTSIVHAAATYQRLKSLTRTPIHSWFHRSSRIDGLADLTTKKTLFYADENKITADCVVHG